MTNSEKRQLTIDLAADRLRLRVVEARFKWLSTFKFTKRSK